MIDNFQAEAILREANKQIGSIIAEHVQLIENGSNFIGCCPFHKGTNNSFEVWASKGFYKCSDAKCGCAGNAMTFVMQHQNVDEQKALKILAQKIGFKTGDEDADGTDTENSQSAQTSSADTDSPELKAVKEQLLNVNAYACSQFKNNLLNTTEGQALGLTYFKHRGFGDETISTFELGYSSEKRNSFTLGAIADGIDRELLRKAGLSNNGDFDKFSGRVMFPIHNMDGKVVAFGGRILAATKKEKDGAKYINSPETELYIKNQIVYGLFHAKDAIKEKDRVYMVEGYTDVISMHQAGIHNVVASCGTSLTVGQIQLIKSFTNNMTILYDGDYAGMKGSLRGIDMLLKEEMEIQTLLLPDGEDPDSFARSHSAQEFVEFVEANQCDFISFKSKVLFTDECKNDIDELNKAIASIVDSIAVCPDETRRSQYIKTASTVSGRPERVLMAELNKKLREEHEKLRRQEDRKAEIEAQNPNGQQAVKIAFNKNQNIEETEILRFFFRYLNVPMFLKTRDVTTGGQYISKSLLEEEEYGYTIELQVLRRAIEMYRSNDSITIDDYNNSTDTELVSALATLREPPHKLSRMHQRFKSGGNTALRSNDEAEKTKEDIAEEAKKQEIEDIKNAETFVPKVICQKRMTWIQQKQKEITSRFMSDNLSEEEENELMGQLEYWNDARRKLCEEALGVRLIFS